MNPNPDPVPGIAPEDMPAVVQIARWLRKQRRKAEKKKTRLKRVKRTK